MVDDYNHDGDVGGSCNSYLDCLALEPSSASLYPNAVATCELQNEGQRTKVKV